MPSKYLLINRSTNRLDIYHNINTIISFNKDFQHELHNTKSYKTFTNEFFVKEFITSTNFKSSNSLEFHPILQKFC